MQLEELQKKIGLKLKNQELLEKALTHSSYINENPEAGESNERLAWLGDAVLYFIVTERLLKELKTQDTGQLTQIRKKYIDKQVLALEAKKLHLDQLLQLDKGEEKQKGRENVKNLHTAYEALLGAIYRDQDIEVLKEYIIEDFMKLKNV